jgi:hypothetical protein
MTHYLNPLPQLPDNHLQTISLRMRGEALSCLVLLLAWLPWPAHGQTSAPSNASIVLVNALPGPNNLYVRFGSEDIWPPGFTPGQSTGAVAFPSGKKAVEARSENFVTTKLDAELEPKANCAMVFYPGSEVKDGPDKGKRKIGLFQPEPLRQELKGIFLKIILVGALKSVSLEINGKPMTLEPERAQKIDQGVKSYVEIRHATDLILEYAPEGYGEYWIVVYEGEAKKLAAVVLNHLSYPLP